MKHFQNSIPAALIKQSTLDKVAEIIGNKFEKLTVISHAYNKHSHIHVNCLCDCGKPHITRYDMLKKGNTTSCGCVILEKAAKRMTTHGMHKTRIYKIWVGMLQRCNNKKSESYPDYGGRGIKVCKEWHKFENFYNDTKEGYSDNLSLDRFPNNKGDYEPNNFRWATPSQQVSNTKVNVYLEYNGEKLILMDWSKKLGIKYNTLNNRVKLGWPAERILTEPVLYSSGKNQFGNNKKSEQCLLQ